VALLFALIAGFVFHLHHTLTQNVEMSFVSAKAQHDQVSVGTIQAVTHVGIVRGLGTLTSDKIENFMFSFSGHEGI
jgi:hypothetical protein